MQTILSEITNPDKRIRMAAIEAIEQFRSRDAIPYLQDLANKADDNSEKIAILEAVEWLKLPTLSEYKARAKAKKAQKPPEAPKTDSPGTPK